MAACGRPSVVVVVVVDRERREMGVVIYLVLTVAIFALLGVVQKLVERL